MLPLHLCWNECDIIARLLRQCSMLSEGCCGVNTFGAVLLGKLLILYTVLFHVSHSSCNCKGKRENRERWKELKEKQHSGRVWAFEGGATVVSSCLYCFAHYSKPKLRTHTPNTEGQGWLCIGIPCWEHGILSPLVGCVTGSCEAKNGLKEPLFFACGYNQNSFRHKKNGNLNMEIRIVGFDWVDL